MDVTFHVNERVDALEAIQLLRRSQTGRPDDDAHRLVRILPQANIVVTARKDGQLVGLARGLREASGCCYLSDLIVDAPFRDANLGSQLIECVRDVVGEQSLIVLAPAPAHGLVLSDV